MKLFIMIKTHYLVSQGTFLNVCQFLNSIQFKKIKKIKKDTTGHPANNSRQ